MGTRSRCVFGFDYVQRPPLPPRIPEELLKVFGGVAQDGPGYIFVHGQLMPVPPRGPIMDILSALAITNLADAMSPQLRQRIRTTALGVIGEIVQNELGSSTTRG